MSTETVALRMGAAPDHAVALEHTCVRYGISTALEKSVFLGNLHHETGGFRRFEENLRYSAKRLAEVWPSRYATAETRRLPEKQRQPNDLARRLGGKPEALANHTYAGRMGNVGPGDGWKFRGRGDAQLTGSDNYHAYSRAEYGDLRVVDRPDMLLALPDRSLSAGWFHQANGCAAPARAGDVLTYARIWNLGDADSTATPHGMDDRRAQVKRAIALFAELVQR